MLKKRDNDRKSFFKETLEEMGSKSLGSEDKTLWEKKLEDIDNKK